MRDGTQLNEALANLYGDHHPPIMAVLWPHYYCSTCLTGLSLVLALFGLCMASSLRYVFMPICLTYAMHPIAYCVLKKNRRAI